MRWYLLPILGAIAAMVAFQLASPFEGTLVRPGLEITDPAAQFTYGTQWGDVNRVAFGSLICGFFCFGLTFLRKPFLRVLVATVTGAVAGGIVNYVTDAGSDVIGLTIASKAGMLGNLVSEFAWCIFVPAGIAFTTMVAIGPTPARLTRACYASVAAMVASYAAHTIVGTFAGPGLVLHLATAGQKITLASFLPVWRIMEIAVGIALGIVMAFADQLSKIGSVRLELGRNEWREWNLDERVNRIGTAEFAEIPLRGIAGVAPVHASILYTPSGFVLDSSSAPSLVNGGLVQNARLCNRDRITVGGANLVFFEHTGTLAFRRKAPTASATPTPMRAPVGEQARAPLMLVDAAGGRYALPPGRYGIGRDATNPICLASEASVSRYHAEIIVSGDAVEIVDLGSTNGTRVNGARLNGTAPATRGDNLQFGSAKFKIC